MIMIPLLLCLVWWSYFCIAKPLHACLLVAALRYSALLARAQRARLLYFIWEGKCEPCPLPPAAPLRAAVPISFIALSIIAQLLLMGVCFSRCQCGWIECGVLSSFFSSLD